MDGQTSSLSFRFISVNMIGSWSIVSAHDYSSNFNSFLIIDGQQRLTTISLLLLAIYTALKNGMLVSQTPMLTKRIYDVYLTNKYQSPDKRIRLKPVQGGGGRNAKTHLKMEPAALVKKREIFLRGTSLISY